MSHKDKGECVIVANASGRCADCGKEIRNGTLVVVPDEDRSEVTVCLDCF